jgi:hypothetical protein
MNRKIKQILDTPEFERLKDWASIGPVQKATLESFAELLVLECAKVCATMPPIGPYKNVQEATLEDASTLILEHFGVEA